jgi:hypothetical protein
MHVHVHFVSLQKMQQQQYQRHTFGGDLGDGEEGVSISAKTIGSWIKFLSFGALIATLAICIATLVIVKNIRVVQSTAVMVSDAFQNLEDAITDVVASYFGIGCIRIRPQDLPYVVPLSHRCYRITGNVTVNSVPPDNRLIYVQDKTDVHIDGGGFVVTMNVDATRFIQLRNSTRVVVNRLACVSPVPRTNTFSRVVDVEIGSHLISVTNVFARNMRHAIVTSGFPAIIDLTVDNLFAEVNELNTSNFTPAGFPTLIQMSGADRLTLKNSRLIIRHAPLISTTTTWGSALSVSGLKFIQISDSVFSGGSVLGLANTIGKVVVERSAFENLAGDRGTVLVTFGAPNPSLLSANVIMRDVSITMLKTNVGGDGIRVMQGTNMILENVQGRGAIAQSSTFRGSFVGLGWNAPAPASSRLAAAVVLRDSTFRAMDNETVSISVTGLLYQGNSSVVIKNTIVHGGLAGVLLTEGVARARLEGVHVTQAIYGIAAVKGARANIIKDSSVVQCCVGIHADSTTRANVFQRNIANECAEGYDNQGTNLLVVDNTAAKANTEFGSTGASCTAPSLNSVFSSSSSLDDDDDADTTV